MLFGPFRPHLALSVPIGSVGPNRGPTRRSLDVAVGGPTLRPPRFRGRAGCSLYFLMTTRRMCRYLHGQRVVGFVGGQFGMVLSALVNEDTHDVLLFAQ